VGDLASVPSERTPKIANSFLDAVYGYFVKKQRLIHTHTNIS
jgi:hypothetical protein